MRSSLRTVLFGVLAAILYTACGGSGCSGLAPLSGGFPSAERTPNAAQLRVSTTGFDAIEANPEPLFRQLFGDSFQVNVSPSCGGSPTVCCPGGVPTHPCGPLELDLALRAGEQPRLVLTPVQGSSRLDVTMRMRVKTVTALPTQVPSVGDCGLRIDTAPGTTPDIQLHYPVHFVQDATAGTTRLVVGSLSVSGLTDDDVSLEGGLGCSLAGISLSFYMGILNDQFAEILRSFLQGLSCKQCPSGDVSSCGVFSTACTDGVCMQGGECLQELGPAGRMSAAALFGGRPPGSAGALDVYGVAGGYAATNGGGAALGVLGGQLPAGTPHDLCGPPATAPAAVTLPQSTYFQGNVRPDTGAAFDFALGIHVSQAQRFAYAAYQGGVLCPTLETRSLPAMTSDALLAVAPSLGGLTRGDRPLWVGLRPQAPPELTLGANSFDTGVVSEPLLSLAFDQAELDVLAQVERQPIRVATVVGDLTVPLGAKSDAPGTVSLVLGPLPPPTNVSVKHHGPLVEPSETLQALAPLLQGALVPELLRRVGPLPLPQVGGLHVAPSAITPVDGQAFIAVFGALTPPPDGGMGTTLPSVTPRGNVPRPTPGSAPSPGAAPFVLLVFATVGLGLFVAARRGHFRVWGALTVTVAAGALLVVSSCSGCPDTGDTTPGGGGSDGGTDGSVACVPAPCADGELEPRTGAWNSVAVGGRMVIATYDERFGDAVLVELLGSEQTRRVVDGLPGANPTHSPGGYRGGVEAPGPNVGAWPSVVLAGDRVRLAYQDLDRGALRFVTEDAQGSFAAHDIDAPSTLGVEAGAHASLALGPDSVPAVAYVVKGLPGANGTRMTELRFARATTATPARSADWTTTVVASAPGSCAGLCGADVCLAPLSTGESERCVTPTNDCVGACGAGESCVSGGCRAIVPAAAAHLPSGTGLHARLLALADGRFLIVHHDGVRSALVASLETASGSGQFSEAVLDGAGETDRGQWAAAVLDAAGVVHVAYVDGDTHQVYALRFTPGSAPSAPEQVDDGLRSGDRPHWVGAGLTAWLDGATFRVAYQDAMTADVVLASRSQDVWSRADLVTGTPLDGFALAAPASGKGPLVWNRLDPTGATPGGLMILPAP